MFRSEEEFKIHQLLSQDSMDISLFIPMAV